MRCLVLCVLLVLAVGGGGCWWGRPMFTTPQVRCQDCHADFDSLLVEHGGELSHEDWTCIKCHGYVECSH